MKVLRPIAQERLKKSPDKKKRIWSDSLEAWGFFAAGGVTDDDEFLLWCSVSPGDRLAIRFENEASSKISTVVGIWREVGYDGNAQWVYRLFDESGRLLHVNVDERKFFQQAWNSLC